MSANAALHYRKAFALLPQLERGEQRLLEDPLATRLSARVLRMIGRSEPALEEWRRGARVASCDWGLNFSEMDFDEPIAFLNAARTTSRLAQLRARHALEHGQNAAALDDFAALFALAHHLGRPGLYLARLVQCALEYSTVGVAAAYLPSQEPAWLETFAARLDRLPAPTPLGEATEKEQECYIQWFRPRLAKMTFREAEARLRAAHSPDEVNPLLDAAQGKITGLLELCDQATPRYASLAKIIDLPLSQFQQALDTFRQEGPVERMLARDAERMRCAAARAGGRLAMLRAAVTVLLTDPEALKTFRDPLTCRPFDYRPFGGGFELKSRVWFPCKDWTTPVNLVVGRPKEAFLYRAWRWAKDRILPASG